MQSTVTTSDLSGAENAQSVKFSFNDKGYVVDLTKQEADELEQFLLRYMSVARTSSAGTRTRKSTTTRAKTYKVASANGKPASDSAGKSSAAKTTRKSNAAKLKKTTKSKPGRKPAAKKSGDSPTDIRAWAKKNQIRVGDRGRIPSEVVEQYRAAN